MARNRKYGASPAVVHFFRECNTEVVKMIDARASKPKACGKVTRISDNVIKRRKLYV